MSATSSVLRWGRQVGEAWDGFWFTPAQPHCLGLIRILAGSMLFYTHLVWSFDLMAFLGPDSWLPGDTIRSLQHEVFGREYTWSYLWHIDSPWLLWLVHIAGLVVFAMLTLGLFTRVTSILAWLITVAYCHRLMGSLFGLDQVNAMLAMYLMIGPSGAAYSLDRLLARRRQRAPAPVEPSVTANLAIRLIQVHLCVIYLFGGIGKMRGEMWWDGSALWFAIANLQYQSLDVTWLIQWKWLIALLTHVTVFWEMFYGVLIWPRLTRPVMLALAVLVHGGIALSLGMTTFGVAMLIANLAFVPPETVQTAVGRLVGWRRAGQGRGDLASQTELLRRPGRSRRPRAPRLS